MRKIYLTVLAAVLSTSFAFAQSGTNSPYSQYGFGVLADQGSGFNRGMNGVGIALQRHNQMNYINPASYSKIDSLSFIFDAGLSLQMTNFKEGNLKKNAKNADFEYAVGAFRAAKHLGMGFGVIPYSNIGYSYSSTGQLTFPEATTPTNYYNTFSGSGGVHEAFVGIGWEPVKNLSIGLNIGYLWGEYTKSVTNTYSDNNVNSFAKTYEAMISNYKLNVGAQYNFKVNNEKFTIGATYELGHKLNSNPKLKLITLNSQTSVTDTIPFEIHNALEIPTVFGAGISWEHGSKWNVAFDWTLEKWSDVTHAKYIATDKETKYEASKGLFIDRTKYNIGAEYCQNELGRSFASRIRYRLGASYTNPYLKINGLDGPKEISVSGGLGLPIVNGYNSRSFLNISAQWVHSSAKHMITENTFRINIGLTFNERWFAKWKFD